MAWAMLSGAASLVGTVMAPVLEMWNQQGIFENGIQCRALNGTLTNSACWQAGKKIVTVSGQILPALLTFTPFASSICGFFLGKRVQERRSLHGQEERSPLIQRENEQSLCRGFATCAGAMAITLALPCGIGATAILAARYAEPNIFLLGYECANRTISNITCSALETAAQGYNAGAGICWTVSNLAFGAIGFVVGKNFEDLVKRVKSDAEDRSSE